MTRLTVHPRPCSSGSGHELDLARGSVTCLGDFDLKSYFLRQSFHLFYIFDSFSESISSIENQNLNNFQFFAKISKNVKFFQNFTQGYYFTFRARLISRGHFWDDNDVTEVGKLF